MNRYCLALAALTCPAIASCIGRSAFKETDGIFGVRLVESGHAFGIRLDPGAFVLMDGEKYRIRTVFGFWTLNDRGPLAFCTEGSTEFDTWVYRERDTRSPGSRNGRQGVAGWSLIGNSSPRVLAGGAERWLEFDQLDRSLVTGFGFSLRLEKSLDGTKRRTYTMTGPLTPVPEPASLCGLAAGLVFLSQRRSKKRAAKGSARSARPDTD